MRLAFWRSSGEGASAQKTPMPVNQPEAHIAKARAAMPRVDRETGFGDLDFRAIGNELWAKRQWIVAPTLMVAVLSILAVNMVTPRYKSEARILIDGRENVFLRPNAERSEERGSLDQEAVTSQVQLVLSRDLASEIIKKNRLSELPEFDPVLRGFSPVRSLLGLFGIGRDPFSLTPEERVLDSYYERLTAYAVDKSRVIVVEFQSRDPELAARVANSIADGYLVRQQTARQDQARAAGQWLSGEIDTLRKKVSDAESRVEDFRAKSSLFIGTNNTTLSNQQMGEINTQLNNARALKSDAESKARLIREMLQSGKPIEASEVLNSDVIRRLTEQRVLLRGQLAEQSSTLLDGHPRIKELKAQLADIDRQIREEAGKVSRSLENDARIAAGRVDSLNASLDQLKKQATSTNGQDVQLRALEREAKAQRDLLESYLAKYREASARENIDAGPADGRIISRATVSNAPAYPKKFPIVLIATLATLMLCAGTIATGELLRLTAPRPAARFRPVAPALEEPDFTVAPRDGPTEEIERLADVVRGDEAPRKVTVLGTAPDENITSATLTLARRLSRDAKVVVVDLSGSSALALSSIDPVAPGLSELLLGEASFAQVITRDRESRAHLVCAGRRGSDRSLLQSPRLTMAIDALLRVYDYVLLDAGSAADLPAELLTAHARAVVVPDDSMPGEARAQMRNQLSAVGFTEVTMLNRPVRALEVANENPRNDPEIAAA